MLAEALSRWLAGEDVHLVAPFRSPEEILPEPTRCLVLLPTDLEATIWAAAVGGAALLRVSARAERDRALTSKPPVGPRWLVSSVDSLHSPVLQRELREACEGLPWLVWQADRLSGLHPASMGRAAWVEGLRGQGAAAGLLFLWSDASLAPEGAVSAAGEPGGLARVEPGEPGALGRVRRGLISGAEASSPQLGHRLGELGQNRRLHELAGRRRRDWQEAARALREEERGLDAFFPALGPVPASALLRVSAAELPSDLAVPRSAALAAVPGASSVGSEPVSAEAVDRARELLSSSGQEWLAVAGDCPGLSPELLGDLAELGVIERLRPVLLGARIADQRRFRAPWVDREPEYRSLHDAYQQAMSGWSLAERASKALTDRARQDLRVLAGALECSPAGIADTLTLMDDDGVVTAALEPLGGSCDWQACRGPRWDEASASIAQELASLRSRRSALRERASSVLAAQEGCRAAVLAEALSLPELEPCGCCDLCDSSGAAWAASVSARPTSSDVGTGSLSSSGRSSGRSVGPSAGLDSLFSSLGGDRPTLPSSAPASPRWDSARLREAVKSGEPDAVAEAVEAAGSPELLWVRVGFDCSAPGRGKSEPSARQAAALVAFLESAAGPGPAVGGRRVRSGMVELRGEGSMLAGHRFTEQPGQAEALALLAELEPEPGSLGALLGARRGRELWSTWLESAEGALAEALAACSGLPELSGTLPALQGSVPEGSAWAAALSVLDAASRGELEQALDELPELDGSERLEVLLLGALGEWAALWESSAELFRAGRTPSGVLQVLEARALLAVEELEDLGAALAVSWLRWAAAELPNLEPEQLERVVASVTGGTARDFSALAELAAPELVARRALAAGALPEKLIEHALGGADRVDVLAAVADLEVRAPALWKRWLADRPRDEQQGFVEAFRDRAPDLALAGEAHLAKLDEREAQRGQALALGAEGRLAEAVPLLAVLPPGDPELDSLRERVAVEQRRFTAPLAGALTSDGHEEEAWAALRSAGEEGWLEGVTLLLRAQARRHPADIRRAGWLARALVVAERWAEAERQFGAAAALEGGGPGQVERELEGVDLALDAGENARAARWLVRLVRTQRNRSLARGLAVRVWGGKIPHEVAEPLLAELRRDGSGLFAGAVRALQDASKR